MVSHLRNRLVWVMGLAAALLSVGLYLMTDVKRVYWQDSAATLLVMTYYFGRGYDDEHTSVFARVRISGEDLPSHLNLQCIRLVIGGMPSSAPHAAGVAWRPIDAVAVVDGVATEDLYWTFTGQPGWRELASIEAILLRSPYCAT